MKIVTCANKHYFDSDHYACCPFCGNLPVTEYADSNMDNLLEETHIRSEHDVENEQFAAEVCEGIKKDCYCCVIHNRCISAWVTPSSYPVHNYFVAFSGKVENGFFQCRDQHNKLSVIIKPSELVIKIEYDNNQTVTIVRCRYKENEISMYNVPLCDAMESWEFIISDFKINHENYKPGFREGINGIYYNIEDEREHKKRYDSIVGRFR